MITGLFRGIIAKFNKWDIYLVYRASCFRLKNELLAML